MLRRLAAFYFLKGYNSSSPKLIGDAEVMSDGSSNVIVTGTGRNEIFKNVLVKNSIVGSKVSMNAGDGYAGLGDHSETGIGSIMKVLGALFFIGAGKVYWNGAYQSASASTTLQLKKFTSGSLGATFQVGLAQSSAATIFAVSPTGSLTGKNNGVVSVKISRIRSQTGAGAIASLASNVVAASSQSIAVTFPNADSNGQDYWEICVTKNGEGGLGNHFFLQEISESTIAQTAALTGVATAAGTSFTVANAQVSSTHLGWKVAVSGESVTPYITVVGADDSAGAGRRTVTVSSTFANTNSGLNATLTRAVDGVARTYVFEWKDSDLVGRDLARTRDYPPPAAVFCGTLQDVTFVDGAYGDTVNVVSQTDAQTGQAYSSSNVGNAIAISDPGKPESFPPDNYIFTNDSPTFLIEGGNGLYWRGGKNSLGVVRYKGGSPALAYDKIWSGIGIANQNNVTLGHGGRLYAFTASRGLVRLGVDGEPDTMWAAPVMEDTKGFTAANTVMGFDGNFNMVLVGNGTTLLAFYEPLGVWCAPLTVTGLSSKVIKSMVTVQGVAYLSYGDNSEIKIYGFNDGTGSTAKVTTAWYPSSSVTDIISRIHAALRVDSIANAITIKVFTNGDYTTAKQTISYTPSATGFQYLPVISPNVTAAKTFRLEITSVGTAGDSGFEFVEVQGESSAIPQ